jgi:hypothetical protein
MINNGIVDFGYKKHFRVHHGKNEFARGNAHINDIESFWGYAKIRLVKFKGMNKKIANQTQWFFLGHHSRAYRGRAVHQSKIRQLQSAPLVGQN